MLVEGQARHIYRHTSNFVRRVNLVALLLCIRNFQYSYIVW